MDMNAISATFSSIGLLTKFVKGSIEKIKDEAVREKVTELLDTIIPLQSFIISLQATNSSLTQEKETIEQKLRNIEDWRSEAASYELAEIASGVYVYVKKKTEKLSEPLHYLCAKCYNDRKKSILQRTGHDVFGMHYKCHSCGSEIHDHSKELPPDNFSSHQAGGGWI